MPPKRKPPKEGLSQVKLFASSKREPSVKMVRKKIKSPPSSAPQASSSSSSRNNLKAEFQALSQGKRPPNSQPAQVFELSDSEGEAEAGGSSRNVMRPIVEQAEGERNDGDGDKDDDNVDLVYHNDGDDTTTTSATPAVEQATTGAPVESQDGSDGGSGSSAALRTSTNAPRRKNTARCSRGGGRGGKRVMNGSGTSESTMRKISSFKPMMKSQAWPPAAAIASTSNGSSSKQRYISPRASPSLDQTNAVSSQKETDPNQAAGSTLVVPQPQQQEDHSEVVASAPSPADTSSEEFHELPEFRRSMSRLTEEAEPPTLSSTNKKRKMITPLESSTDSDLPLADSSNRKDLPPSAPLMDNTTAYISKEEFDKTISALREEMKQEMNKMKEAMRIETKRLIRAEVKDEILLLTQEQRRQH